jgi:SAM-dependent methyltransferase
MRMTVERSPAETIRILYRGISGFGTDSIGPDGRRLRLGKSLVYGELTAVGIRQLIATTGLARGDRFVDLGSGTGRIPLHVALAIPGTICVGIEIDQERHRFACAVRDRAEALGLIAPGICEFRNEDLSKADFSGGTVYFANSTCFQERFLNGLARRVAAMPDAAIFATFRELPPRVADLFDTEAGGHCQTSWNPAVRLHVYRARPVLVGGGDRLSSDPPA